MRNRSKETLSRPVNAPGHLWAGWFGTVLGTYITKLGTEIDFASWLEELTGASLGMLRAAIPQGTKEASELPNIARQAFAGFGATWTSLIGWNISGRSAERRNSREGFPVKLLPFRFEIHESEPGEKWMWYFCVYLSLFATNPWRPILLESREWYQRPRIAFDSTVMVPDRGRSSILHCAICPAKYTNKRLLFEESLFEGSISVCRFLYRA
jgi:hypothetical protein